MSISRKELTAIKRSFDADRPVENSLTFSRHAKLRMKERNLPIQDVYNAAVGIGRDQNIEAVTPKGKFVKKVITAYRISDPITEEPITTGKRISNVAHEFKFTKDRFPFHEAILNASEQNIMSFYRKFQQMHGCNIKFSADYWTLNVTALLPGDSEAIDATLKVLTDFNERGVMRLNEQDGMKAMVINAAKLLYESDEEEQ